MNFVLRCSVILISDLHIFSWVTLWLSHLPVSWCRVLSICDTVSLFGYFSSLSALLNISRLKIEKLKVRVHDVQPRSRLRWSHGITEDLPLLSFPTVNFIGHFWHFLKCVSFVQIESCAFSSLHIAPIHPLITHCLPCCPLRANKWILSHCHHTCTTTYWSSTKMEFQGQYDCSEATDRHHFCCKTFNFDRLNITTFQKIALKSSVLSS